MTHETTTTVPSQGPPKWRIVRSYHRLQGEIRFSIQRRLSFFGIGYWKEVGWHFSGELALKRLRQAKHEEENQICQNQAYQTQIIHEE